HVPVRMQGRYGYNRDMTLHANNYSYCMWCLTYVSAQDSGGEDSLLPFILLMVLRLMLLCILPIVRPIKLF
ncbi:MAG: hypothetical protein MJE68_10405, partial [Proteobacteria bacterium]|nr:hypothetical protein [Pseudomonadota bacterium]